jgi:hypothetical protein
MGINEEHAMQLYAPEKKSQLGVIDVAEDSRIHVLS